MHVCNHLSTLRNVHSLKFRRSEVFVALKSTCCSIVHVGPSKILCTSLYRYKSKINFLNG